MLQTQIEASQDYVIYRTVYCCPLAYERVYLPLNKVANTPFQIQGSVV